MYTFEKQLDKDMDAHTRAPAALPTNEKHFFLINLLKAAAAQLIVLHHLAFYGPMADQARALMPEVIDWLYQDARIAVQVFLVIGGFLAAKSLCADARPAASAPLPAALARLWRRYLKLAPPFFAAMLLAVLASSWASAWMSDPSISAPPTWPQLGAHLLLLHSVLGVESLSAGAWYVAIDFQLYAVMVALLWLASRCLPARAPEWLRQLLLPALVLGGVLASLCYFNLDAGWDVWAPYFFGSYGLGVLAWWIGDPARQQGAARWMWVLAPAVLGLALEFRSRIALAALVACVLVLFGRARIELKGTGALAAVNRLGVISFAIFLVHFPVLLMFNAAFSRFAPAEPAWHAGGMALAWAASIAMGALFHRWVEIPLARLHAGRPRSTVLLRFVPVIPRQPLLLWRR